MKATADDLIKRLTATRFAARLAWQTDWQGHSVLLFADYFGTEITVCFEPSRIAGRQLFQCVLKIDGGDKIQFDPMALNFKNINRIAIVIAGSINNYLRVRPFTIQKFGSGAYRLLDPNGFDYIGQYVTLRDARRTSCNNYRE